MSDFLENVSRSIPTLFYDALARICPGAVLLYFIGARGTQISSATTLDLVTFVVGGYIAGILLTVISSTIFDGPLELLSRLSTRFEKISPNKLWDQIDAIDAHSERQAMLLVKIDAEMTFCQNLFVGFAALVALQRSGYLINDGLLFDLGKPVSWVLGGTILAAVVHRTLVLFRRVRVLSKLLPTLVTSAPKNLEAE